VRALSRRYCLITVCLFVLFVHCNQNTVFDCLFSYSRKQTWGGISDNLLVGLAWAGKVSRVYTVADFRLRFDIYGVEGLSFLHFGDTALRHSSS